MGAFGAGKTIAGVWEAIDRSLRFPGNRGVISRMTYRELEDTTKKVFFEQCTEYRVPILEYRKSDDLVVLGVPGHTSEIMFRSLDDPLKLGSVEIGWFYIDEAYEVSLDAFRMLEGRLRLKNVPRRVGWMTTNPPNVDHWIHKLFVEDRNPNYRLIHSSSYDNPYLPKAYIENLEQNYPLSWRRRFLLGEFGFLTNGKPVYEGYFDRDVHVRKLQYNPARTVYRSWDFGWRHPAVVWFQLDEDGRVLVLKERMGTDIFLDPFADQILAISREDFKGVDFEDFCDPAGHQRTDMSEKSSVEILQSKGVYPKSRKTPIKEGLEIIGRLMTKVLNKRPMFLIDESCKILIEGFEGGYHWPENGDPNSPEKDGYYEHLQDALRYGVVNLLGLSDYKRFRDFQIQSPTWGQV